MKAITAKARSKVVVDAELMDRAITAWAGERLRKQTNREAVAKYATDELKAISPPENTEGPSEDWMNYFEDIAARASSEDLRKILARILAGEIRQPGTCSLRSLQFVAVLDITTANIMQKMAGFIFDGELIPRIKYFSKSPEFDNIIHLESIGILSINKINNYYSEADELMKISVAKNYNLCFTAKANKNYSLPCYALTMLGKEFFSIIYAAADPIILDIFELEIKPKFEADAALEEL